MVDLFSGLFGMATEVPGLTEDLLKQKFRQMGFVSREEFDIQSALLKKTLQKLEQLEARLNTLEN